MAANPVKRNYKIEISCVTIFISLEILFGYLGISRIIQPYIATLCGCASFSSFLTVLSMVRITAPQSILKRHPISIATVFVLGAFPISIVLLLAFPPVSLTVGNIVDSITVSNITIFDFMPIPFLSSMA